MTVPVWDRPTCDELRCDRCGPKHEASRRRSSIGTVPMHITTTLTADTCVPTRRTLDSENSHGTRDHAPQHRCGADPHRSGNNNAARAVVVDFGRGTVTEWQGGRARGMLVENRGRWNVIISMSTYFCSAADGVGVALGACDDAASDDCAWLVAIKEHASVCGCKLNATGHWGITYHLRRW